MVRAGWGEAFSLGVVYANSIGPDGVRRGVVGGGGSVCWSSKRWFCFRLWAVRGVGLEWWCRVLLCVVVMEVMWDCEE